LRAGGFILQLVAKAKNGTRCVPFLFWKAPPRRHSVPIEAVRFCPLGFKTKKHRCAMLFVLARFDKKDANSKWRKFLYIKGFQQFLKYFQRFFRV